MVDQIAKYHPLRAMPPYSDVMEAMAYKQGYWEGFTGRSQRLSADYPNAYSKGYHTGAYDAQQEGN